MVLAAVAKQRERERAKNEHDDRKGRGKEVQVASKKISVSPSSRLGLQIAFISNSKNQITQTCSIKSDRKAATPHIFATKCFPLLRDQWPK